MKFRGKYRFLSNFYPCKIIAWGVEYPTAEHVYVATKTQDKQIRKNIANIDTPGNAKRFGRTIDTYYDWETTKVMYMRKILQRKFANEWLMKKLRAIEEEIIEHNTWHDNYWGACICDKCARKKKKNMLGKLLMEIRDGD